MDKKRILKLAESIEKNLRKIRSSKNFKDKDIGNSQFHALSVACKSAECVEEIKLIIKFKAAKNEGTWGKNIYDKTFADKVLEKVEIICRNDKEENTRLESLSLFFGYLYWSSKIIASEKK
ncbi:hypothetical protein [Anaerosporobacter sp.]|uniref:hypothetical protein n=1 Tax=Anaerosporobacter sp. TaxID=1872529 RepID=UPI00286F6F73|nr:hypothetical protein [Anaerosporobacter sp.]